MVVLDSIFEFLEENSVSRIKHGGAATDSILLVMVKVVTTLLSLVITKLVTTSFSVEDYGIYSQVLLVSTTATSITILGLTDATNYFFNRNKDDYSQKNYINTIYGLQVLIGTLCAVVILLSTKQLISFFGNESIAWYVPWIAVMPVLSNLLNMIQVLFISCKKGKVIAIRNCVLAFIKLAYMTIACLVVKEIKFVVISLVVVDFATVLYMFWYFSRIQFQIHPLKIDVKLIKEILAFSIPMAAYIAINSLSRNLDKGIIAYFGNASELAVYSVASKELPFDLFTASFVTVLYPYIIRFVAREKKKAAAQVLALYVQLSYTVTWLVAFCALVASEDLFLLLYDRKYLVGIAVFIVYIWVDVFRFANTTVVFSACGKSNWIMYFSVVSLSVNAIVSIFSYKVIGMLGPAITTAGVTALSGIYMLWKSGRLLEFPFFKILDIKHLLVLLIELVVSGVLADWIRSSFLMEFNYFVRLVITCFCFFIPVFALNIKYILNLLKKINEISD